MDNAAKEALGCVKGKKATKPYWWDKDIENDIKDKKPKYEMYLNNKTENKRTLKRAQIEVRRKIVQQKIET